VPVLVAIPVAVAAMRCYPLLARLLLWLAGRRPGVTAFVALARAVRSPVSAFLPAFALVLTLAVVAFGAMINAAVLRAQTAASWQRVGADAVVDASVTSQPLTPAVQRQIARHAHAAAAAGVIPLIGTTATNLTVAVAALDPARYAAVTAASTLPAYPATRLARPARPGSPVPVLASALAAARLGTGATDLNLGTSRITVRVVGITADIPAVAAGTFVVLPSWALGPHPRLPTRLLVGGSHLNEPGLAAAVRHAVPGASVTFRSHVLARLAGAPLPRGANRAFALGVFTAAGFSLLIVLLSLLLTARTRELTLSRLLVMGLTRAQARWIAIGEMLPQLIASAAGGTVAAWALTALAGPAIDLTAFSGTVAAAPIRLELGPLLLAVAALVSLALAALIAQVALAGWGGINRALRVVAE
jgi:putative ABC transport system permease protein